MSNASASTKELFVLVACQHVVLAFALDDVERLILGDEPVPDDHARLDLAAALGLADGGNAWALVRPRSGGAAAPVAVRVGACLGVRTIKTRWSVPGRAFAGRGRVIRQAFDVAPILGKRKGVGYLVDVAALTTEES